MKRLVSQKTLLNRRPPNWTGCELRIRLPTRPSRVACRCRRAREGGLPEMYSILLHTKIADPYIQKEGQTILGGWEILFDRCYKDRRLERVFEGLFQGRITCVVYSG